MPVTITTDTLREFRAEHDTFVGIDSDGCVFDTMEAKQKLCFHGLIVSHWGLQSVEPLVRETAEFVNLYSCWRGQNRFHALLKTFELLSARPEIRSAGTKLPEFPELKRLIASGVPLGNPALEAAVGHAGGSELQSLLEWSRAVNSEIALKVPTAPLFPWARQSLERIRQHSDALCVSQTPTQALVREWEAHGIRRCVFAIAGQELGTKAEHLRIATQGRHRPGRILMIGDALGDLRAARDVGACFYPINPGREADSWERFHHESYDLFLRGQFAGPYETGCTAEFISLLPETPPWKTS